MKAVIYSRFSTDRQNESSIADQVRVCAEYATRNDWRLVDKFEDKGISGAAIGNRPGVIKMQEAALARRFDVLLVNDLSRLSRSNGDLSKMLDRIITKGVRVVGVQDGYDSARRGHKLQSGLSGIIAESFRDMIRDRTHAALESRAKDRRPTGGKCYGYRGNAVYEPEATVVREVFERYVDGASCKTIAAELNVRGVASPGAAWNRTMRRCRGWMASGIREMVRNERYTGLIRWNTSEWRKDPDTGRRLRYERPRSEWHEYRSEELRIVPEHLFSRAQERTLSTADNSERLKCGGKSKYLLSGLLRCGVCGSHYILSSNNAYSCSGYLGGDCSNGERIRRDCIERAILDPIRHELLSPERVARMTVEIQKLLAARARKAKQKANAAPAELKALDVRIARLRERLERGDPDMEQDEIQAAIDRAEGKRREIGATLTVNESAKVLTIVPQAAEAYRRQIAAGLDNDPAAASKARTILRKLMPKNVRVVPENGGLYAEYEVSPGALLQGVGTDGSGGVICPVPTLPHRVRLK